jgi:GNAT superfamily N-acetyltransferase
MWTLNELSEYSANAILRDGTPIRIRAIRPADKQRLARHFDGLSSDSRYNRFFGFKNGFTSHELRYFTEPDFLRHVALVVTIVNCDDSETIVGDGRYVALEECRSVAELALSVVDAYQRRGIGKLLLECLIGMARYGHVSRLEADVLASNRGVMRFLIRRGFKSTGTSGGVTRVGLSIERDDGGSSLTVSPPLIERGQRAPYQSYPARAGWTPKSAAGLAGRRGQVSGSHRISWESAEPSAQREEIEHCPYAPATTSTSTRSWKDGACRERPG